MTESAEPLKVVYRIFMEMGRLETQVLMICIQFLSWQLVCCHGYKNLKVRGHKVVRFDLNTC